MDSLLSMATSNKVSQYSKVFGLKTITTNGVPSSVPLANVKCFSESSPRISLPRSGSQIFYPPQLPLQSVSAHLKVCPTLVLIPPYFDTLGNPMG